MAREQKQKQIWNKNHDKETTTTKQKTNNKQQKHERHQSYILQLCVSCWGFNFGDDDDDDDELMLNVLRCQLTY